MPFEKTESATTFKDLPILPSVLEHLNYWMANKIGDIELYSHILEHGSLDCAITIRKVSEEILRGVRLNGSGFTALNKLSHSKNLKGSIIDEAGEARLEKLVGQMNAAAYAIKFAIFSAAEQRSIDRLSNCRVSIE